MAEDRRASTRTPDGRPRRRSRIALPPMRGLTQRQQRGMDCVWCGIVLTPETAVEIPGEHSFWRLDQRTRWYPRACRRGTAAH